MNADAETTMRDDSADVDPPVLQWTDAADRTWTVAFPPGGIALRDGDAEMRIDASDWQRDVYIAPHGRGYIVRFATAEREIGFILSADEASPLLKHIGQTAQALAQPTESADEADTPARPLLWPKVSPLAIWALICSAVVFVPILGLLPAVATAALLILHRKRVRHVPAWNHSRTLCKVAFVFLIVGSAVQAVATVGCMRHASTKLRIDDGFDDDAPRTPSVSTPRSRRIGEHVRRRGSAPPVRRLAQQVPCTADAGRSPRHDSALLAAHSFFDRQINWGLLLASLLVVVFSLSVHEGAHAISAWWLGDDYARRIGRVTLNPIQHIDPFGTVLLPLILYIANLGVFGWARPVPVQVDHLRRPRRAHILVSIAGPGSNLLIAGASFALLLGLGCIVGLAAPGATVDGFSSVDFSTAVTASGFPLAVLFGPVCTVLKLGFIINVFLACFNMIPIPPLDGSWVLQNFFPLTVGRFYERIRPYSLILFVVLIYSGVLDYFVMCVAVALAPGYVLLTAATPF